jgi:prevent-host-death family protein
LRRSPPVEGTGVTTIPQKELRNNIGEVLRRAETGELFTITVAGRPVAELGPVAKRRGVSAAALKAVAKTPAPETMAEDLHRFPGSLRDPFS